MTRLSNLFRLAVGLAVLSLGCDALVPPTSDPTTLTISFINEVADTDVAVEFFTSSNGDVTREVLTDPDISEDLIFTLDAAASFQYAQFCTEVRAAIVANATLLREGDDRPMATTDILLDGMDFECGNFVTFTFSSSGPDNLEIDVTIGDADPIAPDAANGDGANAAESKSQQPVRGDDTTSDGQEDSSPIPPLPTPLPGDDGKADAPVPPVDAPGRE
ncbi:MAG: hypothetical protein ACYTHJ_02730 [Planctomycetota bacterium]